MRYPRAFRIVVALTCLVEFISSSQPIACGAEELDQVKQIFAAVDGPSGKKSTTEASFARLQQQRPSDAGPIAPRHAYLLGLIRLNRVRDALQYSTDLIERNPKDVSARLLRARLLLREKNYAEVFVELETLGELLEKQTAKDPLDPNTEHACRALGLMFGYLEGPAKPLVKATLGKGVKQHLLSNFSAAARRAFDEQYEAVVAEQRELTTKGEAAFKKLQAKHREELEAATARRTALESEKAKTDEEKLVAIARLTKQWNSQRPPYDKLVTAFLNLQAVQTQLVNERGALAFQLTAAQPVQPRRDRNGRVDPSDQDEYDRAVAHYERHARRIENQIGVLDQRIFAGAAALETAWNQGLIAQSGLVTLQQEGARLGIEFELKERAFAREKAKLDHEDPTKKRPTARSAQVKQTFALYDDFNFALEKKRLLDSLDAAHPDG